jgi:hypothetical protein
MKTETIKIFTVDELTEDAQENAHSNYLNRGFEYVWLDEYKDSLKAFVEVFPVKLKNYNWGTSSYSSTDLEFVECDEIANLSGWRLATYIWNNYRRSLYTGKYYRSFSRPASDPQIYHRKLKHSVMVSRLNDHYYQYHGLKLESQACPFTGFCGDEDILAPVWEFLKQPDPRMTFEILMNDCADSLTHAVVAEMESQESFDYFKEHAQANEYQFLEDGSTCYRV